MPNIINNNMKAQEGQPISPEEAKLIADLAFDKAKTEAKEAVYKSTIAKSGKNRSANPADIISGKPSIQKPEISTHLPLPNSDVALLNKQVNLALKKEIEKNEQISIEFMDKFARAVVRGEENPQLPAICLQNMAPEDQERIKEKADAFAIAFRNESLSKKDGKNYSNMSQLILILMEIQMLQSRIKKDETNGWIQNMSDTFNKTLKAADYKVVLGNLRAHEAYLQAATGALSALTTVLGTAISVTASETQGKTSAKDDRTKLRNELKEAIRQTPEYTGLNGNAPLDPNIKNASKFVTTDPGVQKLQRDLNRLKDPATENRYIQNRSHIYDASTRASSSLIEAGGAIARGNLEGEKGKLEAEETVLNGIIQMLREESQMKLKKVDEAGAYSDQVARQLQELLSAILRSNPMRAA